MTLNKRISIFTISSSITVGVFFLLPQTSYANTFSQAPIPSYEPVASLSDTTQVTITEAQKREWKGKFTIMVNSSIKQPYYSLNELVTTKYIFSKKTSAPQTRTFGYSPSKIYAWTKTIAESTNTSSQDPELTIKDGRAVHFIPPVIGKQLDRYHSTLKILQSLDLNQSTIELTVKTTQPNKQLSELNDLGIKELIGRGESKFNGSPANRRHNIKVGVQKLTGVIVKPGEEFSFNKYLGPVEADQGFLPELVIKADKGTVPELGGGLCQVSSTTFRAAMHAGLPITQRRNHSYAVQYYAPQGTDATIYPGVIDLKFTNDTGHDILIWPYFKTNDYLVFDFYGAYDGREVKLGTPQTYDRKADGSMKATWSRTVTKDGETKTDKFASTYLPPALFHKKEEFVANPENPNPTQSVNTPDNQTSNDAPTTPPTSESTPNETANTTQTN